MEQRPEFHRLKTDGIKCLITAEIERTVRDSRRCSDIFTHGIAGDDFKLTSGFDDSDHTVTRCQIDMPIRVNRRGAMPVPMRPFSIELPPRSRHQDILDRRFLDRDRLSHYE